MTSQASHLFAPAPADRSCSPGTIRCEQCDVRRFAFCSALAHEELGELDAIVTQIGAAPHETVIYEGDDSRYIFNLTSGAALVFKLLPDGRRQIVGFLFPGDFVGLAPLGHYAYSVETTRPSTFCRFPRAELTALCRRYDKLEQRLFGMVMDELALAQDQMMLLGRKHARERVASFVYGLSERAAARGQVADPVELPMTRADIADYLGLTTETVSRTLTKLQRDGYIRIERSERIYLERRDDLADLAEQG
jgi:CRP/FNR family transcriptional regulator, anaerobic regulatory protein